MRTGPSSPGAGPERRERAPWLVAWLGLAALGVANGAAREGLYPDALGDRTAHQISTVTLVLLILGYATLLQRWWPLLCRSTAWQVGAAWVLLTVAFELGFGRLAGTSWGDLLADYDLPAGRLWVFVPLTTLLAPPVTRKLRRRRSRAP